MIIWTVLISLLIVNYQKKRIFTVNCIMRIYAMTNINMYKMCGQFFVSKIWVNIMTYI